MSPLGRTRVQDSGLRSSGEAVLGYSRQARPLQEEARSVLIQAAGFALVVMMRKPGAALCAGPLEIAEARLRALAERVRALRVPADARHHHHHMTQTAAALGLSLRSAGRCLAPGATAADKEALSQLLREATDHLRATARILPGFDWVDLGQACCAAHAAGQGFDCAEAA